MPHQSSTNDWVYRRMCNNQNQFAQRRARFRSYEDPAVITAYLERLEREWPERAEIADYIANQIAALDTAQPRVLELCCGPGRLAKSILAANPNAQYTGIDISPPFLAYVNEQLAPNAARITLHELDLSDVTWPANLAQDRFDAIVSMQSLHDVGDATAIAQIYRQAKALLQPDGFFLNADLIVAEGETLPNNPGRLPIPRHLELLIATGYENVRCPLAPGGFGVVMGSVS